MLDYYLLANKGGITLTDKDGNEVRCKDLLQRVHVENAIYIDDIIIINEYYIARPDLVSLAVYGNDKYADYICKYNGISNPFELNENMVIFIPPIDKIEEAFIPGLGVSELIDDDNQSFTKKETSLQKNKDDRRSPAESVVGENNFIIDKSLGVVFY